MSGASGRKKSWGRWFTYVASGVRKADYLCPRTLKQRMGPRSEGPPRMQNPVYTDLESRPNRFRVFGRRGPCRVVRRPPVYCRAPLFSTGRRVRSCELGGPMAVHGYLQHEPPSLHTTFVFNFPRRPLNIRGLNCLLCARSTPRGRKFVGEQRVGGETAVCTLWLGPATSKAPPL